MPAHSQQGLYLPNVTLEKHHQSPFLIFSDPRPGYFLIHNDSTLNILLDENHH